MMRLAMLATVAFACACASAKVNGGGDNPDAPNGSDGPGIDAPDIDAPDIDAALVPITLSQTSSTAVVATQIGCQQTNPLTNFTTENSYYRIFPLSDFNITTPLHITSVDFAVERATAGNGVSQPVQIRLGTYNGTINAASFALANLTQLASATVQVPQNATTVSVPIAMFTPNNLIIQPGTLLYAEVFVPDGRPAGNIFYMGSNAQSETHPSYIRAPDCSVTSPIQYDQANPSPAVRILLTVSGTH